MVRTLLAFLATVAATTSTAHAQVALQSGRINLRTAVPGETYVGALVLKNSSDEPQEAKLYLTDYYTNANDSTVYGEPGSSARSNARWVSMSSTQVILPPNASLTVSFNVSVPSNQSLSGSYWSMVMIEGVPAGSPGSNLPGAKQGQLGLITKIRYAAQIVTDIKPGATREARFEAPANLLAKDSTRAFQFDLKNTGTLAFVPRFTLELYGADGSHVKTLAAERELLYPTTSLRQRFVLGRLPAGSYRAVVTVDAGEDAVFGAQYNLKM
jgi:hypothetical protein